MKLILGAATFAPDILLGYPSPIDVDGTLHKWPLTIENSEVYYEVITSDETLNSYVNPIADESAQLWTDVPTALISLSLASSDNLANITIHYDTYIEGGATSAGYSIFDEVKEGVPVHCSIYIAADDSSDFESLRKTTLHELGHCIGLGHSLVPTSIMSYQLEQNFFGLALDDRAAISRIYPTDGSSAKMPRGCSIAGVHADNYNYLIFLVFIAFPAILNYAPVRLKVTKPK